MCWNYDAISAYCSTWVCICSADSPDGQWYWLVTLNAVSSNLDSHQDNFTGNQANVSGAVLYSTDLGSTKLKCQNVNITSNVTCPEWSQGNQNALMGVGASGYQFGRGIAYPPKSVVSNMPAGQLLHVISNGRSPLPMPSIWVVDQVGQKVSMPGLVANVTVVSLDPVLLPDGIQNATLLNQLLATADANGDIIFNGTVLLAAPGLYNLTVSVKDSQVSFVEICQLPPKLRDIAVGKQYVSLRAALHMRCSAYQSRECASFTCLMVE